MKLEMIAKEFPANRAMTEGAVHHRLCEGHNVVRGTSGADKQQNPHNDPHSCLPVREKKRWPFVIADTFVIVDPYGRFLRRINTILWQRYGKEATRTGMRREGRPAISVNRRAPRAADIALADPGGRELELGSVFDSSVNNGERWSRQ